MKNNSIARELYYRLFKSTFIIQIAIATYSVSDEIIIGNFLGEVALSASTLVLPVFMLLTAMTDMIAIGGASLFSQENGKGDIKTANRYFSATTAVAVCSGLIVSVFALFFIDELVYLFGARGDFIPLTKDYLTVVIYSVTVMLLYVCVDFFVRNDGKPNLAMAANLTFISANVIFSILLVGYMNMGLAGAGWATVIGGASALAVLMTTFFTKTNTLSFRFNFSVKDMYYIIKSGSGMATKYIYKMVTILLFNNLIMHYYSYDGVVVYTVIFNMLMLATAIFEGVRDTLQPIVSTYIGEGNNQGIREVMHVARNNAGLLCIVTLILLELFPRIGSYLFGVHDEHLIQLVNEGIRIYAFVIPLITFNEVMSYYYHFINQPKLTFIIMTAKGLVVILPCNILLLYYGGLNGLWSGFVLTETITMLIVFFIAQRTAKKSQADLSAFLLLRKTVDEEVFAVTIPTETNLLIAAMHEMERFLDGHGIEAQKKNRVLLGVEEIGLNIIEHNQKKKNGLIEIQLVLGEKLSLIVRDNGKNFNPTEKVEMKDAKDCFGLKIVNGIASDFQYVPTIGYNRVLLTF